MKAFTDTFCSVQITASRSQKPPVNTRVGNPSSGAKDPTSLTPWGRARGRTEVSWQPGGWELTSCCWCLPGSLQTSLPGPFMKVNYLPIDKCIPKRSWRDQHAWHQAENDPASSDSCCSFFPLPFCPGLAPQKPVAWTVFPAVRQRYIKYLP